MCWCGADTLRQEGISHCLDNMWHVPDSFMRVQDLLAAAHVRQRAAVRAHRIAQEAVEEAEDSLHALRETMKSAYDDRARANLALREANIVFEASAGRDR